MGAFSDDAPTRRTTKARKALHCDAFLSAIKRSASIYGFIPLAASNLRTYERKDFSSGSFRRFCFLVPCFFSHTHTHTHIHTHTHTPHTQNFGQKNEKKKFFDSFFKSDFFSLRRNLAVRIQKCVQISSFFA